MSSQITKKQAVELYQALQAIGNVSASTRFNFAVALNKRAIQPIIQALRESQVPTPLQTQFEQQRQALLHKHRSMDQTGALPGQIKLTDPAGFAQEVEALLQSLPGMPEEICQGGEGSGVTFLCEPL